MIKNLVTRSISGLIYVVVIFLCSTNYGALLLKETTGVESSPKTWFFFMISIFLIICVYEAIRFMKFDKWHYILITVALSTYVFYIYAGYFLNQTFTYKSGLNNFLVAFLFIIALIVIFKFTHEIILDTSKLIMIVVYIVLPLSLTLILGLKDVVVFEAVISPIIILVFILIWISDTMAYLVGSKFGKRKLAPNISPNKTIEGTVAGVISVLTLGCFLPDIDYVLVVITAIMAPIGDLTLSKLKRHFNVKDSGKLMPGHGGLLDRLDSFIAVVPIIFLYFVIIAELNL